MNLDPSSDSHEIPAAQDTSERKRRAAAARSQNYDGQILPELIAVLAQHERGLRRWSVMRAIRAARSKAAKPIPQKFEEQVERTFRRFSACATDGESRVCTETEAPFYRPAETAGEVWALHPDRVASALERLKTYQ